jgi:hypothetical protein
LSDAELSELRLLLGKRLASAKAEHELVLRRMHDPWVSQRSLEILNHESELGRQRITSLNRLIAELNAAVDDERRESKIAATLAADMRTRTS